MPVLFGTEPCRSLIAVPSGRRLGCRRLHGLHGRHRLYRVVRLCVRRRRWGRRSRQRHDRLLLGRRLLMRRGRQGLFLLMLVILLLLLLLLRLRWLWLQLWMLRQRLRLVQTLLLWMTR